MSGDSPERRSATASSGGDAGNEPLVSVIVPAYQQRRWVAEALDSVLAQTYPRIEVIVVDDGSTDGTGDLVRDRFGDAVRVVRQANQGLAAARNAGLALARGELIQFLDADDRLAPDKIALQVQALAGHPEYDVAYCDYAFFPDTPPRARRGVPTPPAEGSGELLERLLEGNFIASHAALLRRTALRDVGGFDPALRGAEDYDLWLRLAVSGCRFLHTPGAHALYRSRPDSLSSDDVRQVTWTLRVLRRAETYVPRDRHGAHHVLQRSVRRLTDFEVYALLRRAVAETRALRPMAAASSAFRALRTDPAGTPRRLLRAAMLPFQGSGHD
ncbi:MAG: glycosyltransferase [Gemmatimonadota bacterium]|jgi:glycosyltransferase involved in cell wall biosynthesis